MITKETLMNIRSLATQGYSHRQIARMTGLHRVTVKKYLNEGQLPVYHKTDRASLLQPYQELIGNWLSQENFQATRIYELLTAQGYKGSYDTVQRYVKALKERRDRIAYIRFETMPGQQAQVDFGDFQIEEPDGSKKTVYCFIMVLGYSRHMYIEFIEDCTMPNFLACHQHAFGFFGGLPSEILYDNMKNVVVKHLVGTVEWNRTFSSFCVHYGFKPVAAPPYSPWVKGKVERPIHYVRERFWRGYVFNSLAQANSDIRQWINTVAGQRIHGTVQEQVCVRFQRERPSLGALPVHPFDICEKVYRKVYKDCQVSFNGNRYVVPHEYVEQKVLLKIRNGILRIFADDQMLTVYRIPEGRGQTMAHPQFYQRLQDDRQQVRRKYQKPFGKGHATRGLLKDALRLEVMARPLSVYEQEAAL